MPQPLSITYTFNVDGDPVGLLERVRQKMLDFGPVLKAIGEQVLLPSFAQNFMAGGRPKWSFKGWQSDPPMRRTDTLFQAATKRGAPGNIFEVTKDTLVVGVQGLLPDKRRGGELRPYPIAHHIGKYPYKGFPHVFILAQPEDVQKIGEMIREYLTGDSGQPGKVGEGKD
jgi:hypothetical protein